MANEYGVRWSEFEMQAEAYKRLKEEFKYVRGEYRLESKPGFRGCVCDLVIFNDQGNIVLIIEVKRCLSKKKPRGKQAMRYSQVSGCPAIYLCGMEEAIRAVEIVREVLSRVPNA